MSSDPAFLKPVPPDYYSNPSLYTFDFIQRQIKSIPVVNSLVTQISRARLIGCMLKHIPDGLSKYTMITMLDLSDNLFESFNDKDFLCFSNLQNLYLHCNRIPALCCPLPYSLTLIDVSFNQNFNAISLWQMPLPKLEVVKMTHCGLKELPSIVPIWSQTVRSIHLDGNFLTEIPEYFNNFSSLEELSLFGNSFKSIRKDTMKNAFRLLNLYFNQLEDWTIDHNINASALNLNSNLFKAFPVKILESSDVRALMISNCRIEGVLNVSLPPTLCALDVSHNMITELGEDFIASTLTLSTFNASFNQISKIADAFPEKIIMSRLILDCNQLSSFPPSFSRVNKLEQLSISRNEFTTLTDFHLPQLRLLNLSFNKIKSLPNCFGGSPQLSEVNLAFNELERLPSSLSACRRMIDLNASGNKLRVVPQSVMSFSQLKNLQLAKNQLDSLPNGLSSLFFLTNLDLSNNHFSEIPSVISGFDSLKSILFSHNCIKKIPEGFQFPSNVIIVDLSNNQLTNFDFSLPSVQCLNLAFNNLKDIDLSKFKAARFISVSHNSICDPISKILTNLLSLEFLNAVELEGNQLAEGEVPPMRFHVLHNGNCQSDSRLGLGCASTLGVRPTMEDCYVIRTFSDDTKLVGLFDGHSGNSAATISANCLVNEAHKIINMPISDFIPAFSHVFNTINNILKRMNVKDGCTAAALVLKGMDGFAVGLGDSRIVLVGTNSHRRLTVDAKPTDRVEYTRLRSVGLTVNQDGRIGRKLAVSRTLGDFWCGEGIYVEPEVTHFQITEEEHSVIVACDGLWDVIPDEIAANIVRESETAVSAAATLKNVAMAMGSKDNISVIVINLHPGPRDVGFSTRCTVKELPPPNDSVEEIIPPTPTTGRRRR